MNQFFLVIFKYYRLNIVFAAFIPSLKNGSWGFNFDSYSKIEWTEESALSTMYPTDPTSLMFSYTHMPLLRQWLSHLFIVFISFSKTWRVGFNEYCSIVEMEMEESYFILKAKAAQATDPYAAKAWILTAKTLYPNNFGVQVIVALFVVKTSCDKIKMKNRWMLVLLTVSSSRPALSNNFFCVLSVRSVSHRKSSQ